MSAATPTCDLVIVDACVEDEFGHQDRVAIGIKQGRIVAIDPESQMAGHTVIDALGQRVTAGLVDPHVHFNAPGREDWEGFDAGSRACIAGGITSYVDMPLNSIPAVTSLDAFHQKKALAEGQSWADFGLWGGLVPGNVEALGALHAAGAIGIKTSMCDSGLPEFPAVDVDTLRAGMTILSELGLRLALHAEHPNRLSASGPTAKSFLNSRPPEAEYEATRVALSLATETDCPIHIVNVSCPKTVQAIERARHEGIDVTCESSPHYLLLHADKLADLGTLAKCTPPLRAIDLVGGLVADLQAGRIDFIASDHSPCPTDLKHSQDFATAWAGISSVQHGFALMQAAHILPQQELIERMSLHPARVFDIPGKGRLALGYDADLVIWDIDTVSRVEEMDLNYRHKHTPYAGQRIRSQPRMVFLRGHRIYNEGQFEGAPTGRFIRPGTSPLH